MSVPTNGIHTLFPLITPSDQSRTPPVNADIDEYWVGFPVVVQPNSFALNASESIWLRFLPDDFQAAPYVTTNYRGNQIWLLEFQPDVIQIGTNQVQPGSLINLPSSYINRAMSNLPNVIFVPVNSVIVGTGSNSHLVELGQTVHGQDALGLIQSNLIQSAPPPNISNNIPAPTVHVVHTHHVYFYPN